MEKEWNIRSTSRISSIAGRACFLERFPCDKRGKTIVLSLYHITLLTTLFRLLQEFLHFSATRSQRQRTNAQVASLLGMGSSKGSWVPVRSFPMSNIQSVRGKAAGKPQFPATSIGFCNDNKAMFLKRCVGFDFIIHRVRGQRPTQCMTTWTRLLVHSTLTFF